MEFCSRAFRSRFSVALLRNLADLEIHFGREKPEHVNAPIMSSEIYYGSTIEPEIYIWVGIASAIA